MDGMSNPRTPTEAELLAMMEESDADYEAGRFVSGEVVAGYFKDALDRYAAAQRGNDSPRTARRR